ncbi:MAG: hypothetical protein GVX90_06590 [Alphaproteobacteria bacterium]|nr:hypothetical protein [Alphaproteobacteria bacterium]
MLTLAVGLGALVLVPVQVEQGGLVGFGDVRSPAFFPVLAAVLTVGLSIALLVRGMVRAAPAVKVANAPRVLAVTGALAAATAAIFWLGYLITAGLLIAALSRALGNRRPLIILVLAVAVPAGIHLLFEGALNVLLPAGPF